MAQIRGPGLSFPNDSPQQTGRGGIVALPSGGIYVFPQGDYLATMGSQTVLQWFDPNNNQWRGVSGPLSTAEFGSDGGNYRLVNLSGVVVGGSITNAGSGGTNGIGPLQTGSTVAFAAPSAGGVTATAQGYVVVGGTVPAPTVTQAGSGFLVPPLILCDPPPEGGIQATFTCTLTAAGALNTVSQVNPGAGYTSIPQFYVVPQPMFSQQAAQYPGVTTGAGTTGGPGAFPPPGLVHPNNVWAGTIYQGNISSSGALLTGNALTGSGTLTAIVMTYYGDGYAGNGVPAISFAGTSLGAAAATSIMSFCMTAAYGGTVTATGGTTAVTGGVAITSLGLINGLANNTTFFPRPARGTTNAAAGSFALEDPGFGLQGGAVTVTYVGGATLATVTNTQYGGRTDTSVIQSSVNT